MRKYEKPNMEILLLDNFEVITTSTTSSKLQIIPNGKVESESTDWGVF